MPYTFEEVIRNEMIKENRKRPQPRYPIRIEALKVFLVFMGAACLISYAAFYAGGYKAVLYTTAFYVQPWIATYVRRRWNMVVKDAVLAVIFAAWLLLAPNLATGLIAGGYVILLTGYQIVREFSYEPEKEAGTGVIVVNGIMLLFAGLLAIQQHQRGFQTLLLIQVLVYAVLLLKYRYYLTVEELMGSMQAAKEKSSFSGQRIKGFNNRLFWGFCVLVLIAVGVVNSLGADDALIRVADRAFTRVEENLHGAWLGNNAPSKGSQLADVETERAYNGYDDDFDLAKLFGYIVRGILSYWYVLASIVLIIYLIHEDYMRRKNTEKFEELAYTETMEFYKGTAQKRVVAALLRCWTGARKAGSSERIIRG